MRTATSLILVALGAILTFAVKAHPSFLNLQIVGVVFMLIGLAGLLLSQRGVGWLRRRIVLRRGAQGPVIGHIDETNFDSSYASIDPAALQSVQPIPTGHEHGPQPIPGLPDGAQVDEWVMTDEVPGRSGEPVVAEEYTEE